MEYILQFTRTLINRRQLVLLLLGMSSGLPLALSGATLQAWFAQSGVDIVTIGWLSLASQPYVYKMFWAPFLDSINMPLGKRRGWIFLMQVVLAILFVMMSWLDPTVSAWQLGVLAFFVAFSSATQDMAIDAYRTEILPEEERGLGSATFVTGYRIAMLFSGGLALVIAGVWGWRMTYFLMAIYMLFSGAVTLFAPRSPSENGAPSTVIFWQPLREFLRRSHAIQILIFIVLYKLADAFALSLSSAFLLKKGLGFSLIDVGAIYKTVGMGATLVGAFIGGIMMTRISMYRALWYFGILQAISNAMFMWLAIVGKNYLLMVATIFIESFCGGLATVAFMAFLMSLCDTRYTATQYALFSALASIGRVYVGPIAGVMVKHIGWTWFFFWSILLAIPGLLMLRALKNTSVFEE